MLREEEYTSYTTKCLTNKNFLNNLVKDFDFNQLWSPMSFEIINYIAKFNLPTGESLKILLIKLFNNKQKDIYLKILKQYNDLYTKLPLNVFSDVIEELKQDNTIKISKIKNFFFSPYQSQTQLNDYLKHL